MKRREPDPLAQLTPTLTGQPLEFLIGLGFLAVLERLNRQNQVLAAIVQHIKQIETDLGSVKTLERQEMAALDQITADVAANGDAVASAVALLTELHDQIVAAGTDPAALAALAANLEANTQALADAVVANTPAAP